MTSKSIVRTRFGEARSREGCSIVFGRRYPNCYCFSSDIHLDHLLLNGALPTQ